MKQARPRVAFSTQVTDARYYHLNLNPAPRASGLVVVCGGCERCCPDYQNRRSNFPFWGVEFVAEGTGHLRLRQRTYPLRPGVTFLYGPGIPHVIRTDPRRPMLKYFVDFTGRAAAPLLSASPLAKGQAVQVSAPRQVQELFEALQQNGTRQTRWSPVICARLVELLLLKIAETALPPDSAGSMALVSYQRCELHLQRHYLELQTLEQVAQQTHLDPAYLCRLFRRFGHTSPYQSLMRRKMNHAAELLLTSGQLVKQVAAAVGFADAYHFSRVFKSVYRVSPQRFQTLGTRRGTGS